jgi:hypothetical protein
MSSSAREAKRNVVVKCSIFKCCARERGVTRTMEKEKERVNAKNEDYEGIAIAPARELTVTI